MFEDHLNAETSHLKDDFSFSFSTYETSSTDTSEFSSILQFHSTVKDASMILDMEIEIAYFDSRDLTLVNDEKKATFDSQLGKKLAFTKETPSDSSSSRKDETGRITLTKLYSSLDLFL